MNVKKSCLFGAIAKAHYLIAFPDQFSPDQADIPINCCHDFMGREPVTKQPP